MPISVAIVAGVGPGTGTAIARRFAQAYPVVLLARSQASLDPISRDITDQGGSALSIPTDVTIPASMETVIEQIKNRFGQDAKISAAIYNVASKFTRKPFLETTSEEFIRSLEPSAQGSFNFAQATLPLMLDGAKDQHPPTLIFTGMSY